MAYAKHTLVAFGGKLTTLSPGETWQCGVRLRIQLPDTVSWGVGLTDPAGYMNAIAAPLATWFKRAASTTAGSEFLPMRSDAALDWLKVNNINELGRYESPTAVHRFDYAASSNLGAGVNTSVPPFVTAAISWLTALQRGRGHRGRIYLPLLVPMSGAGVLTTTSQTQCNGVGYSLLQLLKAPTDTAGTINPVVASKLNGATNPITAVSTGIELDVQRRRKNKLPEAPYVTRVFP